MLTLGAPGSTPESLEGKAEEGPLGWYGGLEGGNTRCSRPRALTFHNRTGKTYGRGKAANHSGWTVFRDGCLGEAHLVRNISRGNLHPEKEREGQFSNSSGWSQVSRKYIVEGRAIPGLMGSSSLGNAASSLERRR